MGWVYILLCADGSYYVGSTIDLEQRVVSHQLGLGAVYTRRRLSVELLWSAEFSRIEGRVLVREAGPRVEQAEA